MKKRLNNGVMMPQLGFGTFLIPPGEETYNAVRYALEVGYRHIDTAQMYKNEKSVGDAIFDSGLARDEVFITSKQMFHGPVEKMRAQFEQTLKDLRVDYLDLYLIHWPNHDAKINQQTWSLFESLYREKKIRAIGVSNFQRHHLQDLLKTATVTPAVNQIEFHPGLSQRPTEKFLHSLNIEIVSYGPLMRGGIFQGRYFEVLDPIAKKYNKTIPQIVIAWGLMRGVFMIPKSATKSRIKENFESQFIKLAEEDFEAIEQLNYGKRVYTDPDNSPWGRYEE
ncbi:MAG: aldo/keto reductase [Acholeplasmataceae bacterium]